MSGEVKINANSLKAPGESSAALRLAGDLSGEVLPQSIERAAAERVSLFDKIRSIRNRAEERVQEESDVIPGINDDLLESFSSFSRSDFRRIRSALKESALTPDDLAPALNRLVELGADLSPLEFALIELCATFKHPPHEQAVAHLNKVGIVPARASDLDPGYTLIRGTPILSLVREALGNALEKHSHDLSFSETCHLLRALRLEKIRFRGKENSILARELFAKLDEAPSQTVLSAFRELGLSRIIYPPLTQRIIYRLLPEVDRLSHLELAECVRAMGMVHAEMPIFELKLATRLTQVVKELSWKEIALTALGIGELRYHHVPLVRGILGRIAEEQETFPPQEVCSIAWGLSTVTNEEDFRIIWKQVEAHDRELSLPSEKNEGLPLERESLRMLSLVSLYRKMPLPPHLASRAREFEGEKIPANFDESRINGFEKEVREVLKSLGITATPHVYAEGISTDFIFSHEGKRVALFCDGYRYHYIGNRERASICGSDVIATEALKNRGYSVVRISDRLWNNSARKRTLLKKLLAE